MSALKTISVGMVCPLFFFRSERIILKVGLVRIMSKIEGCVHNITKVSYEIFDMANGFDSYMQNLAIHMK